MAPSKEDRLKYLSDGTGRTMDVVLRVWLPDTKLIKTKGKKEWTLFTATLIDKDGDSVGMSKTFFGTPAERKKNSAEILLKYFDGSVWRFENMKDVVRVNPKYASYTRPWVIKLTAGKVKTSPILVTDKVCASLPTVPYPIAKASDLFLLELSLIHI